MAIQHPFTSSSHWRIPAPDARTAHQARLGGYTGVRDATRALAARAWRHRSAVVSAALALVTLGGVLVAPLVALAGLAALLLPGPEFTHPLAAPLIVVAVIWLSLAILSAHACHTVPSPSSHDPEDAA